MSDQRLRGVLADGEALRFETTTRNDERVGLTDGRLLVTDDDDVVGVNLGKIDEIRVQATDWFLVIMSLGLVGFGLYSTTKNVLGGAAFVAAGLVSMTLTVRKRGQIRVVMEERPKPLVFYLDETDPFEEAFRSRVEEYERRHPGGARPADPDDGDENERDADASGDGDDGVDSGSGGGDDGVDTASGGEG